MINKVQNLIYSFTTFIQINYNTLPFDRTTKIAMACLIAVSLTAFAISKLIGRLKTVVITEKLACIWNFPVAC